MAGRRRASVQYAESMRDMSECVVFVDCRVFVDYREPQTLSWKNAPFVRPLRKLETYSTVQCVFIIDS